MSNQLSEVEMVQRLNPPFHEREYHVLMAIQREVERFVSNHATLLQGKTVLDFGADKLPYKPLFDRANLRLIGADIPPLKNPDTLPIDPTTGRVAAADNSFDALISTQVLEHVPDVTGYLREAFRLLKPGAPALFTTHGTFVLHRHPTDVRRWTVDGIRYDLEQAGFFVERVDPRVGILAACTHFRTIAYSGLLRRIPILRHLRPLLHVWCNIQMLIEDAILPASFLEKLPELVIAFASKPVDSKS